MTKELIEQKAKEYEKETRSKLNGELPFYGSRLRQLDFSAGAEWMAGEGERQWISVKDRLPYKDGDSEIFCLVWDTYEGHAVVRPYNEYHKCWDGEDADDFYTDATEGNITHWQLLPEPPKPVQP